MANYDLMRQQGADPHAVMHGLFASQSGAIAAANGDTAMTPYTDLRDDGKGRRAVLESCSMEALGATYAAATDDSGVPQPGRFLAAMNRYTLIGGGTHAFKDAKSGSVVNEIVGTPVRSAPYRVNFGKHISGKGRDAKFAPNCTSLDGVRGHGNPGGDCASCPFAKYPGVADVESETDIYCRPKTRLYIAERETSVLSLVDLTGMARQGLESFAQWGRQWGVSLDQIVVKLALRDHPGNRSGGNNQSSLVVVRPGAIAGDDGDEYQAALEVVNRVLMTAEASWALDVADPNYGGAAVAIGGQARHPAVAAAAPAPERPAVAAAPAAYPPDAPRPVFSEEEVAGATEALAYALREPNGEDAMGDVDDLPF